MRFRQLIPLISARRSGVSTITRRLSSPKRSTIFSAVDLRTPRTTPEDR